MAGCAKTIQINLGVIEVAELPVSFVKIPSATKIRVLFSHSQLSGTARQKKTAS